MIAGKPDLHSLIEKATTFIMFLEQCNVVILAEF